MQRKGSFKFEANISFSYFVLFGSIRQYLLFLFLHDHLKTQL